MKILTSTNHFKFARYIYLFGKNSLKPRYSANDPYEFLSLQSLATTMGRKTSDPIYTYFVSFFNDIQYADTAVDEAFRGVGKWSTVSQRSDLIVSTCAFQIIFLYVLTKINQTIEICTGATGADWLPPPISPWDEAAALLIGSLEGPLQGGSSDQDDGQLHWNLAHRRAFQFQTMNDMGNALINDELEDLIFAGMGEFDALDCKNLDRTATRIKQILLVPLIQSALSYAIKCENLESDSEESDLVLGEVFAASVLPMISHVDLVSGQVIRENMEVKEDVKPIKDGVQVVADAFGVGAMEWGLECYRLGTTPSANPCRFAENGNSGSGPKLMTSSAFCMQEICTWLSIGSSLLLWLTL